MQTHADGHSAEYHWNECSYVINNCAKCRYAEFRLEECCVAETVEKKEEGEKCF